MASTVEPARKLKHLLDKREIVMAPGASDALTARLVEAGL